MQTRPSERGSARIINHSSAAHFFSSSSFPTHPDPLPYDPWVVYGNSKLANLFFTYALLERVTKTERQREVKVIAVHPGYTATHLQSERFPFWEYANQFAMRGPDGALSQIFGMSLSSCAYIYKLIHSLKFSIYYL